MADVRLTATNPEDSSVVPVACDAAGRLLLEEPQVIEGPAGPPGEQGPPGQDGDPFSGNFAGDVTFGGSADFANTVTLANDTNAIFYVNNSTSGINGVMNASPTSLNFGTTNGAALITIAQNDSPALAIDTSKDILIGGTLPASPNIALNADGSAEFAGHVEIGGFDYTSSTSRGIALRISAPGGSGSTVFIQQAASAAGENPSWNSWFGDKQTSTINADGSAVFAGNKAGFTAEGYLWCTTRRGDTVILDFTSNGAGQWVQYTPTNRMEEIRAKLDANRGDTGEMPADTP